MTDTGRHPVDPLQVLQVLHGAAIEAEMDAYNRWRDQIDTAVATAMESPKVIAVVNCARCKRSDRQPLAKVIDTLLGPMLVTGAVTSFAVGARSVSPSEFRKTVAAEGLPKPMNKHHGVPLTKPNRYVDQPIARFRPPSDDDLPVVSCRRHGRLEDLPEHAALVSSQRGVNRLTLSPRT